MPFIAQTISVATTTTAIIVGIFFGVLIASSIIYWAGVFFVFIEQRIDEWKKSK